MTNAFDWMDEAPDQNDPYYILKRHYLARGYTEQQAGEIAYDVMRGADRVIAGLQDDDAQR